MVLYGAAMIAEVLLVLWIWHRYGVFDGIHKVWSKDTLMAGIVIVLTCIFHILLSGQTDSALVQCNRILVYTLLLALAGIDLFTYRIPNTLIAMGIGVRVVLLVAQAVMQSENIGTTLLLSAAGFGFGLLFMLLLSFLTKRGIGYGDVKLFAWLGLCLGIVDTYSVLFYSAFYAAIAATCLLLRKKTDRKGKIPFAPFIFAGMYSVFVMQFVG